MRGSGEKRRPLLTALLVASLWTVIEFVARRVFGRRVKKATDDDLTGDMLITLAIIPPLGWLIARIGNQMGFKQKHWKYRWTPRVIAGGIITGIAGLASLGITTQIDRVLFGDLESEDVVNEETSTIAAILLLIVNGIIVPIIEEFAWRGIIQTAFVERFGTMGGIGLTSLSFSLKHAIVDRSLNRVTMLFALGSIFGIARHRLGTGASTVAHITGNLPASLLAIISQQVE